MPNLSNCIDWSKLTSSSCLFSVLKIIQMFKLFYKLVLLFLAFILVDFLLGFALNSVTKTGTAMRLGKYYPKVSYGGKTGTTDDLRDSWFVGFVKLVFG